MHKQAFDLYQKAQELVLWIGKVVDHLAAVTMGNGSFVEGFEGVEFGVVVFDVDLREKML